MKPIVPLIGELPTGRGPPVRVRYEDRVGLALHHTKGAGGPWAVAEEHVHRRGWSRVGYTWIRYRGATYQTDSLEVVTPHALTHHSRAWYGFALVGNYDQAPAAASDLRAVAELAALLSLWHGWPGPDQVVGVAPYTGPCCAGHRELARGSEDPDKTCPGTVLDLEAWRALVRAELHARRGYSSLHAEEEMRQAGVVI